MTGSPTSSLTSTTSAWSTRGTRRTWTWSSSAATPTSRWQGSPAPSPGASREPAGAPAGGGRLDLAGHALARAARDGRVRAARAYAGRQRGDVEPDDLRAGDHRLGPLRRPAAR